MNGTPLPQPSERELRVLRILWDRGEATVREVYELMRGELGIVQNTVQTLMRGMSEKGLLSFRRNGRTFVYAPVALPAETRQRLVDTVLERAFDGAIDQLVASAVSLRPPTADELARLRRLLDQLETPPEVRT